MKTFVYTKPLKSQNLNTKLTTATASDAKIPGAPKTVIYATLTNRQQTVAKEMPMTIALKSIM